MDQNSTGTDRTYKVLVDDNYHYMEADKRSSAAVFKTYDEALEKAKQLVDRSLRDLLEPGQSADDLMAQYCLFGEDPFIRSTPEGTERFSARDYARQRAPEIVNGTAT